MFIKEIALNNFRIYKGQNSIYLQPEEDKNIVIVSGKNGYGKTTFLMSLVWCLYGKQMEKVDELYQKEISDKGGYGKYIGNSLNRQARAEGETQFSVSVTFTGVKIPDVTCNEVQVTRHYDTLTSTSDRVEILIDGHPNELIEDLTKDNQRGEEIFIRDFILPLEIAKFFFFDAEKIVSLAEINSPEQRRLLSKAYSEVLGIQKYEELKQQLEGLQDDYRKKSAKPKEREEFNTLIANIENATIEIEALDEEKERLNQEKIEKKYESEQLQQKLIQEGNQMTLEELTRLKDQEAELEAKLAELQEELRELFDLIPFGLAGERLLEVSEQVQYEQNYRNSQFKQEDVDHKVKSVLDELEVARSKSKLVFNDIAVRDFYESQFRQLIKKHFFAEVAELPSQFEVLHDFSESKANELTELIQRIGLSFKEKFGRMNAEYSRTKNQLDSIRRTIRQAEKDAESEYISDLRRRKEDLDKRLLTIDNDMGDINQRIGAHSNDRKAYKQKQEELRKKIDVSLKNKQMDDKAQQLINHLKVFMRDFKSEKKKSLEKRILKGLQTLLHKQDFIKEVTVDISHSGEDVDINLTDYRGQRIDKGALSMGERQMYASALLNALVDESDIAFPVFIDSPMQKFDEQHAENIIRHFYPNVSHQVVIFPLINKELTREEFKLIRKKVSRTYLIKNLNTDHSQFEETKPSKLMERYNELYYAAAD